ncbi:MAG: hypothetical protein J2P23_00005, partial [Microlunatus sp.]|nr:hypothetical protein [Microlunatus sp.]
DPTRASIGRVGDDDRHWLAGTIYFNRDDRRLLVPKKLGFGYGRTLNLARPTAWLIISIPVLLALIIGLSQHY